MAVAGLQRHMRLTMSLPGLGLATSWLNGEYQDLKYGEVGSDR